MGGSSRGAGAPQPRATFHLKRARCACVVEQMPTGASGAWRIAGNDDETCMAKLNAPPDHAALNEPVCACIAEQFGPSSFEPVLARIGSRQAAKINKGRAGPNTKPTAAGIHLAARPAAQLHGAGSLEVVIGHKIARDGPSGAGCMPGALGLDALAQNCDRHCGSARFVFDTDANSCPLRMFGHGHAFGGPSCPPGPTGALYQDLVPISELCLPADGIDASCGFDEFLCLAGPSLSCTPGALAGKRGVPAEWCTEDGGIVDIKHAIESLDSESLKVAIVSHLQDGGGA